MYEGQWKHKAKHGEGVYVFEDNSTWSGMWENDQPVESSNTQPFAAQGPCPKVYVQDLLDHEQNTAFAAKGTSHLSHRSNKKYCTRPTSPKINPFTPNKHVQVVQCLELLRCPPRWCSTQASLQNRTYASAKRQIFDTTEKEGRRETPKSIIKYRNKDIHTHSIRCAPCC